MWFMNHVFNPIISWILRSRLLHPLASKNLLLIAFTGKKSGKHYVTPVEYLQDGQTIWIMAGFPEKKHWWRNLIGGAPVNLCLRGEWVSGEAFALSGEGNVEKLKSGLSQFAKRNPQRENYFTSEKTLQKAVLVQILLD
jgi:deazaflavin-dependent oxidoreductase (nitroreductase family)